MRVPTLADVLKVTLKKKNWGGGGEVGGEVSYIARTTFSISVIGFNLDHPKSAVFNSPTVYSYFTFFFGRY